MDLVGTLYGEYQRYDGEIITLHEFTIDNTRWFLISEIMKSIGYSDSSVVKQIISKENYNTLYVRDLIIKDNNSGEVIWKKSAYRLLSITNEMGVSELIIRTRLMDKIQKSKLIKFLKLPGFYITQSDESRFTALLGDFLDSLNINYITQYRIGKYRIDIFLPDYDIAIEYDEIGHNGRILEDIDRAIEINELSSIVGHPVEFVRCNYRKSDAENILLILAVLNKHMNFNITSNLNKILKNKYIPKLNTYEKYMLDMD